MRIRLPQALRLPSSLLWVVSIGSIYILLWKLVEHLSGKWLASYWFAVGLGVILAFGLLVRGARHLVWAIPFACLAVFVSWLSIRGIYLLWSNTWLGRWWGHLDDLDQSFPTLFLMIILIASILFIRAVDRGWRYQLSIFLFGLTFLIMSLFADIICSIQLPPDGTIGAFDHDILGFRLGGYYLIMVASSVVLLKRVSMKLGVIAPNHCAAANRRPAGQTDGSDNHPL